MKRSQFKGYVLEEILAYLIRSSWYKLITKKPENDSDLSDWHNGLNIRWRGTNHQIDVLGELNWIPAFNFPLRLIIEAKFRSKPTGIEIIRENVGLLTDINQNYFIIKDSEPKPRYRYTSVVFSTSGFTEPAVDMAVAHQVQLADLSNEEYNNLKVNIDIFVENVFGVWEDIDRWLAKNIRKYLSNKLKTREETINDISVVYINACEKLIESIKWEYKELFVGMSKGGFMLLLKAENPTLFVNYAKKKSTHDVIIQWFNDGEKWVISPIHIEDGCVAYKLTFKLPSALHKWIFEISENKVAEALYQKEKHFPTISIYYHDDKEDKDYIFNLKYH